MPRRDLREIYVPWTLDYDQYQSADAYTTSWEELAEPRSSHGVDLLFTKRNITCLSIYPKPNFVLFPPTPRPFFSFARLAHKLASPIVEWRYSVFGYALDDGSLLFVKVSPDAGHAIQVLAPDEPFPL